MTKAKAFGRLFRGKSAPEKEEDRHDEEIHDQRKALHVLDERTDGCSEGGEYGRDGGDKEERRTGERANSRGRKPATRQTVRNKRHWMAATVAPPSVRPIMMCRPRNGADQRFLQEPELPVPQNRDAGKDGTEEDGHADDAGSDELQIASTGRPGRKRARIRSREREDTAWAGPARRRFGRASGRSASTHAATRI